jgi:hypothetical protein
MTYAASALTRRTALTALAAVGSVSMAPAAVGAPAADRKASLERALEALRVAMVAGDGKTLNAMLHDSLNYMHSSGNSQTKANLLGDLAGKRFFAGLTYSDQTLDIVENTGTVVQTVDQVKNLPDGKTRASQIKVLQTWLHTGGRWQLLSRVSAIIYSPLTAASCRPS